MSVRDNKLRFLATVMFLTFLCVLACPAYDLLIRVERRGQDDKKLLMEKGLSVTAEVSGSVFVLGGDEELAILGKRGFACEVIDSFPELSDYYLVGVRDDSDIKAVHAAGTVIYSEENLLLLRVPSGMELASLHDAKVFVSPFGKDPIREPLFKDAKLERKESLLSAPIPLVQKMVGEVSTATIDSYWETLVNNLPEGTRNSTSQGCYDASAYVLGVFDDLGLKTRSLSHTSGHAPNSEGEVTGAIHPSVIYLIEGHLDDMPSSGPAPGADDNASGSVAVMEAARVLSCYPFKNTVRFLTVTGEEYGLYGSTDYANDAYSAGENIQGVLNFDMPGWAGNGSPNPEDLDLNYNSESEGLGEFFADCATTYSTGLAVDAFLCPSLTASDHYGFWQKGYKAVCGITDNEGYCGHSGSYPYYHTANDTIANCGNKNFFYSVVKTGVAALAELGEPFRITFDKSSYSCGGNLQMIVGDRDLNTNSSSQQTFSIGIRSTVETEPETLVLTEDDADSMIFRGNITLTGNPPAHGDGFLSVGPGSFIEADYVDAVDCGGALNVSYSASAAACTPPVISNVRVTSVTGDSAVVEWTTSVPATSRVTYGITVPPATVKEDASTLATEHSLLLSPLSGCSLYYFSVTSVDEGGNTATDDNGGSYHSFSTPVRVYKYGPDTVESGTGIWTASGGGTSIWHRDNCKASSGSWSWKAGLSDSPTCTGNYGSSVTTYLTSSGIVLGSSGHGYHLRFREWYSTESGYDFCTVQISTNGTTYTDLSPQRSGASGGWIARDYDLAAYSGTVYIRFRFTSDNYSNSLGWFVDDMDVSYATPCAPSLAVSSAVFTDDCLGTGSGDGDGYLDPGEEAVVTVILNNTGYLAATGVWAELDTTAEGVTVLDGTASFPGIPVGGSGTSVSPHFRIRLAETAACGTAMPFTVSVHSNEGGSESSFELEVGHWVNPVTNLINESFDGTTFPPTGWTKADTSGSTGDWLRSTGTVLPTGGGTHSGSWLAYFKASTSGNATRLYRTSGSAIPSGSVSAQVSFWMYHDTGNPTKTDRIQVQVSTDGTNWATPGSNQFLRCNGSTGWQQHSVDLSSYIGQSIRIGFLGTWMGGNYCHIDDVVLSYNGADYCVINACTPPSCVAPSVPSITDISDNDGCQQSGITITFTPGSPATRHDLYRDGSLAQSGVSSPLSHDPGDTASHGYIVRAVNGSDDCYSASSTQNFADGVCTVPPEIATGASGNDAQTWSEDKATQSWPSAAGATGYRLYRGALADLVNLSGGGTDSCTRHDGTGTSVDLSADDPSGVAGGFYWYLVTAYNGAGEGSAGAGRTVNSSGACAP